MNSLIISANSSFYPHEKAINNVEYRIIVPDLGSNDGYRFEIKGNIFVINNKEYWNSFLMSISRRGDVLDIAINHEKYGLNKDFLDLIADMNALENNMFKSLFMAYFGFRESIEFGSTSSLEIGLYDALMITDRGFPGQTDSLYYVSREIIKNHESKLFSILVNLNLLVRLTAKIADKELSTYAIPVIKIGVGYKTFNEYNGDGKKAFQLWKDIVSDRNKAISRITNNRIL